MKIYLLCALVIGLVAAHEDCPKPKPCKETEQLCFKPPRPGPPPPPPAEEDRHACPPKGRCKPKFVEIDGKKCPRPCQKPRCPRGTKICKMEDPPKTEDGCPLPMPPICVLKRQDCPTKDDLAACDKQPKCAKTEKLCFAPPPPPPADGEEAAAQPKCPPVGKCAPKDMANPSDETKTCPAPCPCPKERPIMCEAPQDAPTLEDGCPLPLPPKCVVAAADCPEA